eukprot:gene7812-9615_t
MGFPIRIITYDPSKDPTKIVYRKPIGKKTRAFKGFFSEFLGTMFLVFFCGGSVCSAFAFNGDSTARILLICIIQGFTLGALIWAIAGISGCNLNPAVTLANCLSGRVGVINSISYLAAQVIGCIAGAGILYGCLPAMYRHELGVPHLGNGVNTGEAFQFEMYTTCFLCLTVLGTSVFNVWDRRLIRVAPLAIGLALLVGVGVAGPFTGGALNPVRVLGPSIISGDWANHWVYWLGPLVGAAIAAFIYRVLLQERFDVIERPGYVEPLKPSETKGLVSY